MHQLLITALALIVVYGFGTPLQTVSADSGTKRWGIVTKTPVEEGNTVSREAEKSAVTPDGPPTDAVTPPTVPGDQKQGSPTTTPATSDAKESAVQKAPENKTMKTGSPAKTTDSKSQDSASKPEQPEQKKIKWDNENQKKVCENYLQQLQAQFLKTRHYSIQGVPCKTADHAEEFLQVADKCENECPKGLIESSGYTSRIVRNIKFLEKLGNDKCDDTLPATDTAPNPTSDASQSSN